MGILLVSQLSPSLGELGVNRIKPGLKQQLLHTALLNKCLSFVLFYQEKLIKDWPNSASEATFPYQDKDCEGVSVLRPGQPLLQILATTFGWWAVCWCCVLAHLAMCYS